MLLSPSYQDKLIALVVDEVHCVKTWGDKFRVVFVDRWPASNYSITCERTGTHRHCYQKHSWHCMRDWHLEMLLLLLFHHTDLISHTKFTLSYRLINLVNDQHTTCNSTYYLPKTVGFCQNIQWLLTTQKRWGEQSLNHQTIQTSTDSHLLTSTCILVFQLLLWGKMVITFFSMCGIVYYG